VYPRRQLQPHDLAGDRAARGEGYFRSDLAVRVAGGPHRLESLDGLIVPVDVGHRRLSLRARTLQNGSWLFSASATSEKKFAQWMSHCDNRVEAEMQNCLITSACSEPQKALRSRTRDLLLFEKINLALAGANGIEPLLRGCDLASGHAELVGVLGGDPPFRLMIAHHGFKNVVPFVRP
jgi:hypothetical protein